MMRILLVLAVVAWEISAYTTSDCPTLHRSASRRRELAPCAWRTRRRGTLRADAGDGGADRETEDEAERTRGISRVQSSFDGFQRMRDARNRTAPKDRQTDELGLSSALSSFGLIALLAWLLNQLALGGGGDESFVFYSESASMRTVRNADGSYSTDVNRDVKTNIKGFGQGERPASVRVFPDDGRRMPVSVFDDLLE